MNAPPLRIWWQRGRIHPGGRGAGGPGVRLG
jgi:hypothetical protein